MLAVVHVTAYLLKCERLMYRNMSYVHCQWYIKMYHKRVRADRWSSP